MSDRCAFVYDCFYVLPPVIHAIVDPYGGLWHFVLQCWAAAPHDADTVSQFLAEVLESTASCPEAQAVTATCLSYLVSSSPWAQLYRDALWQCMQDICVKMHPWAAGRGRLCLAMCYFGHDDFDHGRRMRASLMNMEDAEEKVKLTLYVCGKVRSEMASAILGYSCPHTLNATE